MADKDANKYKKMELLEHVYTIPDTYIGAVSITQLKTYIYEDTSQRMIEKELEYVPGLYKIFDEIIVNALDQCERLKASVAKGVENIKPVKTIRINIDKASGKISVMNDGDGIDIIKHPEYDNVWIPELIFGSLLTSANYNQDEERLTGGKNGMGGKLTNIFSKEFIVETIDHRRGLIYTQRFYDNMK